ncbi:XdhC family protein [Aestuariivirga litoralis]|uniref:XdhC family protein n=1 Tax=Aestuariivirga litoralis TaxID=2650924 RepID=A0A2W2AMY6_9HYPH|nr:XdhC family protein [Aestuariivirga litoralis]PZF76855.1 XdhC family protein [Aestuariivirga litoralis]
MKRDLLDQLLAARANRQAVALITNLETGAQRIVPRSQAAADPLAEKLDEAFRFDQSGTHDGHFVNIHNPPLRMVIIGAVHIAQSVIPIAQQLGYDVAVIDPRGAFATGARFPGISLHAEWPDEVIPQIGLDPRTALIALTHDPKIDDPALNAALKSDVFYIGALGSKKTQAARAQRLKDAGFTEEQVARIHGPIGLNIGAKGAPEIAVSIMGEVTRCLRLGS